MFWLRNQLWYLSKRSYSRSSMWTVERSIHFEHTIKKTSHLNRFQSISYFVCISTCKSCHSTSLIFRIHSVFIFPFIVEFFNKKDEIFFLKSFVKDLWSFRYFNNRLQSLFLSNMKLPSLFFNNLSLIFKSGSVVIGQFCDKINLNRVFLWRLDHKL